jgi:cysteine sulfinate desulfinase/cysteine desulfurase-like protein
MHTLFLDFFAVTPLDPAEREPMLTCLGAFGDNPSIVHHFRCRARAALDEASYRVEEKGRSWKLM